MARVMIGVALAAAVLSGCSDRDGGSEDATGGDVPFRTSDWRTDFSEHSVPLEDFTRGGPPKDGIPSIDDPSFVSVADAEEFLGAREPVAVVELGSRARAYPLQILIWHEIVNDEIDGEPVAVTYCPLCNSTVAFRRELDGEPVEFGTTGMLRNSDLVMYDRETESWWQQITAEAVVGELTGTKLEVLASQILSWKAFRRAHPDGEVLSRDTGFSRDYGSSPYSSYDRVPDSQPFLFEGEPDASLPAKERVAAVKTGDGSAVVYPFSRLETEAPINDEIEGRRVAVFFDPDVSSALDESVISAGRSVGAAAVFDRAVDGRALRFERGPEPGVFSDSRTASSWDMTGRATGGPLKGTQLEQIPHDDQFWFALAAFFDDADIRASHAGSEPQG